MPKCHLLPSKRLPFTQQKVTFQGAKDDLLQHIESQEVTNKESKWAADVGGMAGYRLRKARMLTKKSAVANGKRHGRKRKKARQHFAAPRSTTLQCGSCYFFLVVT